MRIIRILSHLTFTLLMMNSIAALPSLRERLQEARESLAAAERAHEANVTRLLEMNSRADPARWGTPFQDFQQSLKIRSAARQTLELLEAEMAPTRTVYLGSPAFSEWLQENKLLASLIATGTVLTISLLIDLAVRGHDSLLYEIYEAFKGEDDLPPGDDEEQAPLSLPAES